jgi:hypothetical protein
MHFRKWTALDHETARPVEAEFVTRCEHDDDDEPYFYNVFQQAFVRAWIEFAHSLIPYEVAPPLAATILVDAMAPICFSSKKDYFGFEKTYARLSLYKDGGAVIVTEAARDQWKRLILMTLLNDDVWKIIDAGLAPKLDKSTREAFKSELMAVLAQHQFDFFEDLSGAIKRDFERNWQDRDVLAQHREALRKIIDKEGDKSEAFTEYVEKHLTAPRLKKAKTRLRSVLELQQPTA